MTHEYSWKYGLKHLPGSKPNERIAKATEEKSPGGELACGDKIREKPHWSICLRK